MEKKIQKNNLNPIARIIGYDEIPLSFLSGQIPKWEPNLEYDTKIFLQDILVGIGLSETISYSATSEKLIKSFKH